MLSNKNKGIKAAAVILISLFSRVKDFQSMLKEQKMIQTLKRFFIPICHYGWLEFHQTAG